MREQRLDLCCVMISKHNKKKANCFAKSKKPQRPQSSSGGGTSLTSVLLDPKHLSLIPALVKQQLSWHFLFILIHLLISDQFVLKKALMLLPHGVII